jgi:DNA-binding transcriptional ArsR family regulator
MVKYQARLNDTFAALADPTRRAILARLSVGPAPMRDIAEPFHMSWPAITKHVKVLERARLVRRELDGREHRIHLTAAPLHAAHDWIGDYRTFWEGRFDALARYLDGMGDSGKPRRRP